ncbi:hypothetical protein GGI03_007222, partial [Coemansia sp. RSA 2337]
HRFWSPAEIQMLQDLYPLLRHARTSDMETLTTTYDRPMHSICVQKSNMVCKLDTAKLRPLTNTELDVVRAAVDAKSAENVTWKDVRDQLPGRSFAEVSRLLEKHRADLYRYEKSRRN